MCLVSYKDLTFVLVASGVGFASMVKNEGGNTERDSSDVSKGRAGSASGATGAADPSSPSTSDDEGGAGSKQSTEDGDDDEPDSKRRYLTLYIIYKMNHLLQRIQIKIETTIEFMVP